MEIIKTILYQIFILILSVFIIEGLIRIINSDMKNYDIEIKYIRRPNMLENIEPRSDIVISAGDILVIIGTQDNLNLFEKYTINGE